MGQQNAWYSDCIPQRMFQKVDIEKNQQKTKSMQNFPVGKEFRLYNLCWLGPFPINSLKQFALGLQETVYSASHTDF